MTWLESFSYCSLASEESIQYLDDGEYKGWVGGIYLNSQWMIHKGCYSNSGAVNSYGVYDMKRLTPALCSEKCKMIRYLALKDVDSSKCTFKCRGSNNDVCGERSHFTVYKHITGKFKPKGDVDQTLACSVVMPRNNKCVLKVVDCSLEYWTTCVISGGTTQMGVTDTYKSAIRRCSSVNGTILSTFDTLDHLEDGKEYWTNIIRSRFLKWITHGSFDEVCYAVDGLFNVDCVYLTVKYRKMKQRRKKARSEGKGTRFELGVRQPNTKIENRSYEKPWDGLKILNIGISECPIYDEAKDQSSPECQIYDEAKDQYQHLDFEQRSKQRTFLEAEYDVSMPTVSLPMPDINNSSSNNAVRNVVSKRELNQRTSLHFPQGPLSKNKSAKENVAYCDTAIVHTKFLYDTPNQSKGNAKNS
ncbi:unnamed protein product [Mytilus coruscus]|uniref:Uncharacterized protein n=1 Tax=Mytilus coruscus TaxID=42192 RepID=A0A6J8CAH9_MYTCO|nr:unnamed protein product [Mytilus coruscus]